MKAYVVSSFLTLNRANTIGNLGKAPTTQSNHYDYHGESETLETNTLLCPVQFSLTVLAFFFKKETHQVHVKKEPALVLKDGETVKIKTAALM